MKGEKKKTWRQKWNEAIAALTKLGWRVSGDVTSDNGAEIVWLVNDEGNGIRFEMDEMPDEVDDDEELDNLDGVVDETAN